MQWAVYRLWPVWPCFLPDIFWNGDHTFQSGSRSLENERVKKALKTKVLSLLPGRESTRDHEIPGERLKTQPFLWARGPTFNLIPTQVEVIYISLCLTACWQSAQKYTGNMEEEISTETKQAPERQNPPACAHAHTRGTYSPSDCAGCPPRPPRGWSGSISSPQYLQGSDPCNHWSYKKNNRLEFRRGENIETVRCLRNKPTSDFLYLRVPGRIWYLEANTLYIGFFL